MKQNSHSTLLDLASSCELQQTPRLDMVPTCETFCFVMWTTEKKKKQTESGELKLTVRTATQIKDQAKI